MKCRSALVSALTGGVLALALTASASADPLTLTAAPPGGAPASGARTIPHFTGSFSSGGITYPYQMVGTDPAGPPTSTTVATEIIPLKLVFADGQVADIGNAVDNVAASPLFEPARFSSGYTQYGDAMRRAMFWREFDGSQAYHVLLGQPTVLPVQTISVPRDQGQLVPQGTALGTVGAETIYAAAPMGVVDPKWFSTVLDQTLNALHVDPATLPILLSRNVIKSDGIGGEHFAHSLTSSGQLANGADNQQAMQTGIWASYADPAFYQFGHAPLTARTPGQNIDILSHEVSEWLHDPFVDNTVPGWRSPLPLAQGFYGCSSLLETGDPIADVTFLSGAYQLQDEAYLQWFSHGDPSVTINDAYSYTGAFTAPAPSC